jgi:iron complex outermembrane receptor protein
MNGDEPTLRFCARIRTCLWVLGAVTGLVGAPYAMADQRTFDVPAGDASVELREFARQAGLQILFNFTAVNPIKTQAVSGQLEPEAALTQMLRGTGLAFTKVNDHTVAIRKTNSGTSDAKPSERPAAAQPLKSALGNPTGVGEAQLEEVIVTAQKRSENLQDTPLSISAISGERLAQFNAKQLSDFAATIPGLQVDSGGAPGFNTITLRGISTGALFGASTTAIYVDDVPTGSSSGYIYGGAFGIDLLPYDLDRIEVLRGPQGTLYGASSMGGLVKYVLNSPSLTEMSFRAGADVSDIDHGSGSGSSVRGYGNIVLIPGELAISVSGAHTYLPGYINNTATGERGINNGTEGGGRVALLWKPNDQLSVKLTALSNYSNFNGLGQIQVSPNGIPVYGKFDAYLPVGNGLSTRTTLYSADINYNFGWATLTSISAYSDQDSYWRSDSSTFPFAQALGVLAPFLDVQTLHKFSQEVRLASSEAQDLQWVLGGFYTQESAAQAEHGRALDPVTKLPNPLYDPLDNYISPSSFKEAAVFANATYQLTSVWDISAGVRYSHNRQTVVTVGANANGSAGYLYCTDAACTNGFTAPYSTPVFPSSDNVTTYSVSTRYHFAPDAMVYARVASGYRPGASNQGVEPAPATFSADTLTNYEIGIKSELFDKSLLIDADIFDINWNKIQVQEFTDAGLAFTNNAATAVSRGLEFTTEFAFTHELRLGLSAVYDLAKLTADAPGVGGSDGDRLPLTPRWSGAVTGSWTHALTDTYSLKTAAVWRYVGERFGDFPLGSNFFRLPSYNAVDLSAGVSNGHWTVNVFGRNLTDEYAYLRYNRGYATVLQPRTVGLSIDIAF